MLKEIKNVLLSREPFKPSHMGIWIRALYFKYYSGKLINFKKIKNALDAGCGKGYYSKELAKYLEKDSKILAIDVKAHNNWQETKFKNIEYKNSDLRALRERNFFDLIISIDVLEHIKDNKKIMARFYDALKVDGILYLAIPCKSNYILPKFLFKKISEWEKDEHIGEQYSLPQLKQILENFGFRIIFSRYTFTLFGRVAWELETIFRGNKIGDKINIILMPIYKFLGILDLFFSIGRGNNLIIARK